MASERAKAVGDRIKQRRMELQLTQEELAQMTPSLTVTGNVISRWERGRNRPSHQYMEELAGALGVSSAWLLFGQSESPAAAAPANDQLLERLAAIEQRLDSLTHLGDISKSMASLIEVLSVPRDEAGVHGAVDHALSILDGQAPPRTGDAGETPSASKPRARRAR